MSIAILGLKKWAFAPVLFCVAASFPVSTSSAALIEITAPGDPITGISSTTVGGNDTVATVGTGTGQYPTAEAPPNAIDRNTATKYLNFGNGNNSVLSTTKGVGTGFYVTPALGSSIVTGIQLGTANDSPNRDPITVSLEGSNATGSALDLGSSWTLINGSINLGDATDPGRSTLVAQQVFANALPFTSYRVIVQSQRGSDNSTQYSELNLFGVAAPEPASIGLFAAGSLILLGRRRRLA